MARLSRPRKKKRVEEEDKELSARKEKRSNFWLLLFISLNIFVLAMGYRTMDIASTGMYSLLVVALLSIYVKKRFNFSAKTDKAIETFGLTAIVIAFVLFLYVLFHKFSF